MTTSRADLLAGVDMEGGEGFCDSIYNFLKNQGKDINLLTNSGFGVWSQSDTNKGVATMAFDSGSVEPVVGELLTGATSASVGKVISVTVTGGTWGGTNAAGTIELGACAGRFNDNEDINGSVGGANMLTVNEPDAAVGVDLIRNGEFEAGVGGWAPTDCALASIAGGQVGNCLELTRTGGATQHFTQSATTVIGKIYRLSFYVKSGTSGNEAFSVVSDIKDGAASIISGTSAAGWVLYSVVCEAAKVNPSFLFYKNTATAGTMLFDEISVYEITPCCTGADNLAMDEWGKNTTADIYREHSNEETTTKRGSFYALKVVPGAAADWILWSFNIRSKEYFYKQFRGRTITLGLWVNTNTASHARARIHDVLGSSYSDYHTGGGSWEWLEVSHTVDNTATNVQVRIDFEQAPNVDGSTIVYVSQPMLVFGSSIGEGMYQPRLQEIIYVEKKILSKLIATSLSTIVMRDLNIEADTEAMLPKGCKAIQLDTTVRDAGSAGAGCFLYFRADATVNAGFINRPHGKVNDTWNQQLSWCKCDPNGDIQSEIIATGAGTFDINDCNYLAVQVN